MILTLKLLKVFSIFASRFNGFFIEKCNNLPMLITNILEDHLSKYCCDFMLFSERYLNQTHQQDLCMKYAQRRTRVKIILMIYKDWKA